MSLGVVRMADMFEIERLGALEIENAQCFDHSWVFG